MKNLFNKYEGIPCMYTFIEHMHLNNKIYFNFGSVKSFSNFRCYNGFITSYFHIEKNLKRFTNKFWQ